MRVVNERRITADLVDDLFPSRWSPRSFTGERISDDSFAALVEAARWAPSSRNMQPWRLIYTDRDSSEWETFTGLLNESNREWAHKASHLVLFLSEDTHPGRAFDTGAAWMSFALQAQLLGLGTHPMGGFKKDESLSSLNVPDGYVPMAMVAVGPIGTPEDLPEDRQDSERTRSDRKPFEEVAHAGSFPEGWN